MRSHTFRCLTVSVLLCVLLFRGMDTGRSVMAAPGSSKSSEEKELEQKRKDTLEEIQSLKSDISSVEKKIKELETAKSGLQTYIQQLDQQANAIAAQITELEEQIEKKIEEIAFAC